MSFTCNFLFHGSLNDFLPRKRKEQKILYSFKTPASIKDAIEAIGVPHVEVMKITVNRKELWINDRLQHDKNFEVFPFHAQFPPLVPKTFVLDVHLGKLARLLRMLGFDVFYQNNLSDKEIVNVAAEQKRSVLTRDVGLLKHRLLQYGYWLRSQQAAEQLLETIQWFSLCPSIQPFSRCLACNGLLHPVEKKAITNDLLPQTKTVFDEFYQCATCRKVYWKGSHYDNMQRLVDRVKSVACQ